MYVQDHSEIRDKPSPCDCVKSCKNSSTQLWNKQFTIDGVFFFFILLINFWLMTRAGGSLPWDRAALVTSVPTPLGNLAPITRTADYNVIAHCRPCVVPAVPRPALVLTHPPVLTRGERCGRSWSPAAAAMSNPPSPSPGRWFKTLRR